MIADFRLVFVYFLRQSYANTRSALFLSSILHNNQFSSFALSNPVCIEIRWRNIEVFSSHKRY